MQACGRENGPLGPAEHRVDGVAILGEAHEGAHVILRERPLGLEDLAVGRVSRQHGRAPNTASASKRVPRRAAPDDGVARPPPARPGHHAGAAPEHARSFQRPAWLRRAAARAMAPWLQQRRLIAFLVTCVVRHLVVGCQLTT